MKLLLKTVIVAVTVILNAGCSSERFGREAEILAQDLSRKQLIGQMLMFAVPGKEINETASANMRKYLPGGIILFGYNLSDREQTARLIDNLQEHSMEASGIPLFVSIDQEGGRVWRVVDGATQFPGAMTAGVCGDRGLARKWGTITGLELRRLGINMNLAPVLDVNNNPDNPVINTRSFGSDAEVVSEMGAAYIKGMRDGRCIAVGKHFPGHGDTNRDSHLVLPIIRSTIKMLRSLELVPFKRAIDAGVDCIMTAHIAYPGILKSDESATVSKFFLTEILRKELGFNGIIMTDDMEMNAISKEMDVGRGAVRAIDAGADIVLLSSYGKHVKKIFTEIESALDEGAITEERLRSSVRKILELKIRYGLISIEEGNIRRASFTLDDKQREILKGAEGVNGDISRCGIGFHGDLKLIRGRGPVFCVTRNSVLRRVLRERKNIYLAQNLRDIDGMGGHDPEVIWYHHDQGDPSELKRVRIFAEKRKLPLVVVATGNPFPAAVGGHAENMLITFSNTSESLVQAGKCLLGEYDPKTGMNLNLGFPDPK